MPEFPDRDAVRAFMRRHRRPLAALSAGAAVLIALSTVRQPAAAPATGPRQMALTPGTVAISVELDISRAHLIPGAVIDVVSIPEDGTSAHVVTRDTDVLDVASTSTLGASSATNVLLGASEADALALADAAARGPLTALIHSNEH